MSGWVNVLGKVCVCVCSVASACLTLCDPMNGSPPLSSVHEILHTRILEWVAMSSPGDLPYPGIKPALPASPALHVDSFIHWVTWEVQEKYALNPYFQFWFIASWLKQVTKQKKTTKTEQKETAIPMGPTTFSWNKREPSCPREEHSHTTQGSTASGPGIIKTQGQCRYMKWSPKCYF